MTLREVVEPNTDDDPLGCAFIIAAVLRTALQREPSTMEGECATIMKAMGHFDLKTGDGVRVWLGRLGKIPDMELPDAFWLSIADAAENDDKLEDE